MNTVRIENGSAQDIFAGIKTEWQHLFAAADVSPFLSWEWMSVWFASFGENKTPFILKTYRDDNLIGILPMFREEKRFFGIKSDRLALMGEGPGGADHLDVIARPEDKADAIMLIFEYLNKEFTGDKFQFDNLSNGSLTPGLLRKLGGQPDLKLGRTSENVSDVCPQINLSEGWNAVLATSKRKENFKRKLKKLEKMPGFEFRSVTSPDQTGEAFERFLHLHNKRWEKAGGSELSGHPRLAAFQRRLIPELASAGLVRFDELWLGGECLGSVYGLDDGRAFYYYNAGYDLEFAHLSVGLALLGLSIQSAVGRGNLMYDFLRGDETYKSDWANRRTELVNLSFSRNTLPVIVQERICGALNCLRVAAKNALPSVIAESVGNWRRSKKRTFQLSER